MLPPPDPELELGGWCEFPEAAATAAMAAAEIMGILDIRLGHELLRLQQHFGLFLRQRVQVVMVEAGNWRHVRWLALGRHASGQLIGPGPGWSLRWHRTLLGRWRLKTAHARSVQIRIEG
ncbi:hypothetical protein BpHYR1_009326 [Brachionus plicatilis]|uniref:Uncharacterized protein n=1 Tax=Brachionus plicatilis TaxID=10195 RepID=A0A3M7P6I6_BRAPC|nr:hypothetical protein BpHYR1_009326 [Brachionus plicatilis]